MRKHAGGLLRAIATALALAAERIDPQLPAELPGLWLYGESPCMSSTTNATIKFHRTG
jgi:hypothetical protein